MSIDSKPTKKRRVKAGEVVLLLGILAVVGFVAVRLARCGDGIRFAELKPNIKDQKVTIPGRPHFIPAWANDPDSIERKVTFTYSTNSHGFRGPEFSAQKPAGTFRIIVVGECVAFGNGVDDQEVYPAVLGRMLKKKHPGRKIEVINLGTPDSPQDIRDRLRDRYLGYSPDLVVFAPGAGTVFLAAHSGTTELRNRLSDEEYRQAMDEYGRALEDATSLSTRAGARVLLVTPTTNSFFIPDGKRWVDRLKQFAAEKGLPVVDTTAIFLRREARDGLVFVSRGGKHRLLSYKGGKATLLKEVPFADESKRHIAPEIFQYLDDHPEVKLLLSIDENHPNPRGHEVIAEAIYKALVTERLLDPPPPVGHRPGAPAPGQPGKPGRGP